ncbi:MAG: Lrp/AsnC family transcriptional regulator [Pseudomonadota bacterium]
MLAEIAIERQKLVEIPSLDDSDRRILRSLVRNGRISIHDLSADVGLSPSPVSRRVRLLQEAGVIEGYTAQLDEGALGYGFSVFVSVKLEQQVDEAMARFEAAIQNRPEVVDCWLMTGNRDYLMRIAARDLQDFERFLVGHLTKIPGVSSIESSIPLRRVKAGVSRTE